MGRSVRGPAGEESITPLTSEASPPCSDGSDLEKGDRLPASLPPALETEPLVGSQTSTGSRGTAEGPLWNEPPSPTAPWKEKPSLPVPASQQHLRPPSQRSAPGPGIPPTGAAAVNTTKAPNVCLLAKRETQDIGTAITHSCSWGTESLNDSAGLTSYSGSGPVSLTPEPMM
ncbi:uncharacterized protein LOC117283925 isoform X2 [Fukomys damarensis]|uniref:uncharacterized protein LOC117283925 isoform X2 n=1 Tax=Fukomys damarensis TaxID=885580 RepID=UPI00053F7C0E|nr:uncharacterized protein LOC117283925 isoform X2 [Fukomys damarensis]